MPVSRWTARSRPHQENAALLCARAQEEWEAGHGALGVMCVGEAIVHALLHVAETIARLQAMIEEYLGG